MTTNRPSKHVHKLIAETAKAAANELYDVVMTNNQVRAEWKRQNPDCTEKQLVKRFVDRNWSKCIDLARATLARLLTTAIDDKQKTEIHEALCLDASLIRGRLGGPSIGVPNGGPTNR